MHLHPAWSFLKGKFRLLNMAGVASGARVDLDWRHEASSSPGMAGGGLVGDIVRAATRTGGSSPGGRTEGDDDLERGGAPSAEGAGFKGG